MTNDSGHGNDWYDDRDLTLAKLARDLGVEYSAVSKEFADTYADEEFQEACEWYADELAALGVEPESMEFYGLVAVAMQYDDEVPAKALVELAPMDFEDPWTHVWKPRTVEDTDGETYWVGLGSEDTSAYTEEVFIDDWGNVYDSDMFYWVYPGEMYQPASDEQEGKVVYAESWDEYANTLVTVLPDGTRSKILYSGGVYMDFAEFDSEFVHVEDTPHEDAILAVVNGTGWNATDAWRGYEDGPSEAVGFVKAKDTWHGTMTRTSASDRINELSSGDRPMPFPVMVAFTRTSNLFSQGLEVFVPEDRTDDLQAYFEGATAGLDGGRF